MPALRWTTLALVLAGYVIALAYGQLYLPVLLSFSLLIMAGVCVTQFTHWAVKTAGHLLFVALAIALASHWLPGFYSARAIAAVRMSPEAEPFSMALNLDKPLIAFWVILLCPWVFSWVGVRRTVGVGCSALVVTACVCLTSAMAFGLVGWAPKWPEQVSIWALNNLLLVTLTEELFFRGYIQGGLNRLFKRLPYAAALAIGLSSALFGLAHAAAGWQWVLLATIAGIGYGVAYRLGGLSAAVAAHFGLNLLHFSLFTYPMFDR